LASNFGHVIPTIPVGFVPSRGSHAPVSLAVVLVLLRRGLRPDPSLDQRANALGGVRPLASADAAQPWTGVGRLDTGVSFCSATLISDRLVLTAAHCLFRHDTGISASPDDALTFQAGLRNGRPEACAACAGPSCQRPIGSIRRRTSTGSRRTWRCWSWSCRCVERDRAARRRAERRAG
jgi:hypothetical protein